MSLVLETLRYAPSISIECGDFSFITLLSNNVYFSVVFFYFPLILE